RGIEGNGGLRRELLGVPKRKYVLDALARHAGAHQAGRSGGAKNLAVWRDVIGVGMGNEGPRLRKMSVEPPPDLGEPHTGAKLDLPRHERVKFERGARSSSGRMRFLFRHDETRRSRERERGEGK